MALYECVFIARQDVASAQVEALTEAFTEIITENGGSVAKTEYWGLKTLAYRIKKNRKGHYTLMNIDAPFEAVSEMERQMRLHDDVLRQLVLRVDAHEEGPSAMMQSRSSGRDGRDGRRGDRDGGRPPRENRYGGDRSSSDRPAPAPETTATEGAEA
ncbi:MAG: 30S ribosomal protein S6 [Pseudomonadota bacterium]